LGAWGALPEVSTIVVVRFVSAFGGIVIVGTIVWMLGINESLTSAIISLDMLAWMELLMGEYVDLPTP